MKNPKVYFISGHCDITSDDFLLYYQKSIDNAISEKAKFVLGESPGVDRMAQQYLLDKKVDPSKVTIYHMMHNPRFNINKFNTNGGYSSHNQKDKAMTLASDADIAWLRSEEEQKKMYGDLYQKRKSGTENNLERRVKLNKLNKSNKVR